MTDLNTVTRADDAAAGLVLIARLLKDPDFIRAAVADVKRRRRVAEQRRASRLIQRDPAPSRALSGKVRKIGDIDRDLVKARQSRNRPLISALEGERRKLASAVEAERTRQIDTTWAIKAVAESAALALARGEEVETVETEVTKWRVDRHGVTKRKRGEPILDVEVARATRVMSRTGLALAFARGHLDGGRVSAEALFFVGGKYREAYEASIALRTPDRDEGAPSAPRCKPSAGISQQVLEAGETLKALRSGLNRRQIKVLDLICGRDMAVKAAADIMRAGVPSIRRTLVKALSEAWANRTLG
jgi:hypothetical protein